MKGRPRKTIKAKKLSVNSRAAEKERSLKTKTMQKAYKDKNEDSVKKTVARRAVSKKRMANPTGKYGGSEGVMRAMIDIINDGESLDTAVYKDIKRKMKAEEAAKKRERKAAETKRNIKRNAKKKMK